MPLEADFVCPACGREVLLQDLEGADALPCPCGEAAPRFPGSVAGGRVARCALCGDPRLYVQKDFSRVVGIGLLAGGFLLALLLGAVAGPWGFFLTLGASAALDALLYGVAGSVVVCHWCEAHYRGGPEDYPEFDLEVHDLVRHQRMLAARGRRVPAHEGLEEPGGEDPLHPVRYDG